MKRNVILLEMDKKRRVYESPITEIVEIETERILCQSTPDIGGGEGINGGTDL